MRACRSGPGAAPRRRTRSCCREAAPHSASVRQGAPLRSGRRRVGDDATRDGRRRRSGRSGATPRTPRYAQFFTSAQLSERRRCAFSGLCARRHRSRGSSERHERRARRAARPNPLRTPSRRTARTAAQRPRRRQRRRPRGAPGQRRASFGDRADGGADAGDDDDERRRRGGGGEHARARAAHPGLHRREPELHRAAAPDEHRDGAPERRPRAVVGRLADAPDAQGDQHGAQDLLARDAGAARRPRRRGRVARLQRLGMVGAVRGRHHAARRRPRQPRGAGGADPGIL